MVEYALIYAIRGVAEFLLHEAKHIPELRSRIELIQMKLRQLQDILEIAVSRQEEDKAIRNWVGKTREVACDIEDLLLVAACPRKEGSIFKTFTRWFREGTTLHFLEPKIQLIDAQIDSLQSDLRVQNIRTFREGSLTPVLQRKQVVSITGMGGIGKTTIAKKVYHHDVVRSHFNAFAWACISQQWQPADVLQKILNKLEPEKREEIEKMDYDELVEELYKVQTRKRCLIVLDDVWDMYIWDLLRHVFFTRHVNIKVLMTTRNKEIARDKRMGIPCYLYEQRHLNEKESWELLQKKLSRGLHTPGSKRSEEDDGSYSRFDDDDAESSARTFYSCQSDVEEEEVITPDTPYSEECSQGKSTADIYALNVTHPSHV